MRRVQAEGWTCVLSLVSGALLLLPGCAAGPTKGQAGGVAWEVVDMSRTDEPGGAVRWAFTVVLKEVLGTAVDFETLQVTSQMAGSESWGGMGEQPYRRRLGGHSELRQGLMWTMRWGPRSPGLGTPPTVLGPTTLFYRFLGKRESGEPVSVVVRVPIQ